MSYQVIARKWRPQQFADVIGQQAVTRTLQNALSSGRLAQAFVFAGPRGVGKTTTARILARALSCADGPTANPCGRCDACVEIAEGRDIDVLEIDAATHTGVDNVREVIIAGLSIRPVRNRYKIFIIDEVHQLSTPSFNALLKSIEEPPPHVVFMMATTELDRIPETVLSRSQVFEFRTIGTHAITEQLRRIVDAEGITAADEALQLVARDAEGSMRDAQSKLDQVIAFTGKTVTVDDVATVLGLVGRDLLLDAVQAVADDNAPAAFALAGRAVELGYDLRAVCRELSRVVRDLLVLSVDPSRISDPEIAGEGERDRLKALAARFSREDLLRAFDLLTRAEAEIRGAAQPRYHLEMALLRWIHLRKLTSIEDLIIGASSAGPVRPAPAAPSSTPAGSRTPPPKATSAPAAPASPSAPAVVSAKASTSSTSSMSSTGAAAKPAGSASPGPSPVASGSSRAEGSLKDALLAEVRKSQVVFYNTVVAQAYKVESAANSITFVFASTQRTLKDMFEQKRPWLEEVAQKVSGRKIAVVATVQAVQAPPDPASTEGSPAQSAEARDKKASLRDQAMADASVQALLDVFPAEIRDVEEM